MGGTLTSSASVQLVAAVCAPVACAGGNAAAKKSSPVKFDSESSSVIASRNPLLYVECMARSVSTTVRLDEEDIRALKRAREAGFSASDLIRRGLRVAASRYYSGRRPPLTLLFESTNAKLGDESELFRDIED